jgi:A/G-specific adenine glycosylase
VRGASIQDDARAAILAWFDARGRSFPFRGVTDPYAILVSEAMAQQTQIARASERWTTFMARFPTIEALAAAAPAEVLREWRGLGYNRRAINLWRAARAVVEEHGGRLPHDIESLERLPGIGPYTARAVAALAFGRPVGAVDTNVRRVLSRMAGARAPLAPRDLQALADDAVPPDRPGDWTHALMDIGATVCKPSRPDCPGCPAREWCGYAREAANAGMGTGPATAQPAAATPRRARRAPAFRSTSRWLRGRLLDHLRDGADHDWVGVPTALGEHETEAVDRALVALERDGLVERHPTDRRLARLPLG